MRWTIAILLLTTGSGWTWAQPPSSADVQFFESKIRPLLVKHCFECHSQQAKKQRGSLRLDSRARMLEGGDSGPAVVPGRPEQSRLIEAVRQINPKLQMPP